ncbi:MAG: helix-turn-helix transcriptional regulator [Anaerolineae bacterium]|nr:helix-turn-helix transcriptional regulator [Anaerolineae bacterium]MBL8106592.1 helix-turn-helix transcriptional regulator [Anaerolineales bacterium]
MMDENISVIAEAIVFTKREAQVIQLLKNGKSTKQIALQLGMVTRSVEVHLTYIYAKLNVCCRAEAVAKLIRLYEK